MRSLKILAVAAVATGAVAVPGMTAQAATLHPTKEFVTPTVTVTTTTGQQVRFSLDMYHDSYDTTVDVDLSKINRRGFGEDHDWTFQIRPAALTYSKGKGTLVTDKAFGPYGRVSLSFSRYAQSARSCHNDNGAATRVTTVTAKVKGIVVFIAKN